MLDRKSVLVSAATHFRTVLEQVGGRYIPHFSDFPRGCCGDTCYLLATYLSRLGLGCFRYVNGWRNGFSHGWLVQDEVIIDITADQFEDGPGRVIVSNDSAWHQHFVDGQEPEECFLAEGDLLLKAYHLIAPHLQSTLKI